MRTILKKLMVVAALTGLILAATSSFAAEPKSNSASPQSEQAPATLHVTPNVTIDGVATKDSGLVGVNQNVATPAENGAVLSGARNTISIGPNTQLLRTEANVYSLDRGTSQVNTTSGMTARVKAYTIKPADPTTATQYEVTWASNGVYVFARNGAIEITGPCNKPYHLDAGRAVNIPDPTHCGVSPAGGPSVKTWPYAVALGGAAAAGATAMTVASEDKPAKVSGDSPSN